MCVRVCAYECYVHVSFACTLGPEENTSPLSLFIIPLRESLSPNMRLTFSWLSWKITSPSNPPQHGAGVTAICGGHLASYAGAEIRTPVPLIVEQVLLTSQTSL